MILLAISDNNALVGTTIAKFSLVPFLIWLLINDKQDFHKLYELMNGMPLREMDQIVYPVCTLCRDHERSGFIHGVQVGMRLAEELK